MTHRDSCRREHCALWKNKHIPRAVCTQGKFCFSLFFYVIILGICNLFIFTTPKWRACLSIVTVTVGRQSLLPQQHTAKFDHYDWSPIACKAVAANWLIPSGTSPACLIFLVVVVVVMISDSMETMGDKHKKRARFIYDTSRAAHGEAQALVINFLNGHVFGLELNNFGNAFAVK